MRRGDRRPHRTGRTLELAVAGTDSEGDDGGSDAIEPGEEDRFAAERQEAREAAQASASLRRRSTPSHGEDEAAMYAQEDAAVRGSSMATRNDRRAMSGVSSTSAESAGSPTFQRPIEGSSARLVDTNGASRRAAASTVTPKTEAAETATNSASSRSVDSVSVKSEESATTTTRSSGRRTRPSAKLTQASVPHRDASETDSLSLVSATETQSNTSLQDNHFAIATLQSLRPIPESGTSEASTPTRTDDRAPTAADFLPVPGTFLMVSTDGARSPLEARPLARPALFRGPSSAGDDVESDGDTPIGAAPAETDSPVVVDHDDDDDDDDVASSSDLSDVSSISSLASAGTTSSTGSTIIRRLGVERRPLAGGGETTTTATMPGQTDCVVPPPAPSLSDDERRRVYAHALELVRRWRAAWLSLDRRVRQNVRKQERNRAAREQQQQQQAGGARRRR